MTYLCLGKVFSVEWSRVGHRTYRLQSTRAPDLEFDVMIYRDGAKSWPGLSTSSPDIRNTVSITELERLYWFTTAGIQSGHVIQGSCTKSRLNLFGFTLYSFVSTKAVWHRELLEPIETAVRRFNDIPKNNSYWFLKECEWRSPGSARTHCSISVNHGANLKSTSLSYIGLLYYFMMVRFIKRNCSSLRKSISRRVLTIICVGNADCRGSQSLCRRKLTSLWASKHMRSCLKSWTGIGKVFHHETLWRRRLAATSWYLITIICIPCGDLIQSWRKKMLCLFKNSSRGVQW
jgi:hypothetical protein